MEIIAEKFRGPKEFASKGKYEAFDNFFVQLWIKDVEKGTYELAKIRERKIRVIDHVRCTEEETGRALVREKG